MEMVDGQKERRMLKHQDEYTLTLSLKINFLQWCIGSLVLCFPSISLNLSPATGGKESTCNAGDLGSIPGLGISPREGNGYPL